MIVGFAAIARTAEVLLRPIATPGGTVVRLGDIADLRGGPVPELQALADRPLMPAPPPGTKRFLSVREIRDVLVAGGMDLAEHRFTGAAQVAISGHTPEALRRRVGSLSPLALRRVEADLGESIRRYLSKMAQADEPWLIELALDDDQRRQLAEAPVPWLIEGGGSPWVGHQTLTIVYQTTVGTGRMAVEADVSLPEPVAVLTRPLQRGDFLSRADVALVRPTGDVAQRTDDAFHALEDIVGKIARRPLREGLVLAPSMIEAPTLVRRGQLVSVVAIAHGIRIKMEARARQSGAAGDLVQVETLDTREPFAAQVSGDGEVQVIGR